MRAIPKPVKKNSDRKKIVKKLDTLVSQIIRKRVPYCVTCNSRERLQCSHIFSRVAYSTRWDFNNLTTQCAGCNMRHEHDSFPLHDWFIREYSLEDFRILHALWKQPKKWTQADLEALYEKLSGMI